MNTAVTQPVDEFDDEEERALFKQAVAEDPDLREMSRLAAAVEKDEAEQRAEPVGQEEGQEEGQPEGEQGGEAEQKAPTGFEWLDDLSEESRAKAQEIINRQAQDAARWEQRAKSHLGQLQPTQRALTQMQQKMRAAEDEARKRQGTTRNSGFEAEKKAYNEWVDKEYEDFPEEAAKLKSRFTETFDGVLRSIPAPPRQELPAQVGPDPSQEVQHLATAYSDWGERRYSPEFNTWLSSQHPETQQLLNSPFAADNIALLDAFTRDNPMWIPPQTAEDFHSLAQAQHSPLYRGWAEAEGINPDTNLAQIPDFQRDMILTRFKSDLAFVYTQRDQEQEPNPKAERLAQRRNQQLKDRAPSARRSGVKPGQQIDLETEDGQREYYAQLVASDPELNR